MLHSVLMREPVVACQMSESKNVMCHEIVLNVGLGTISTAPVVKDLAHISTSVSYTHIEYIAWVEY